MVKIQVLSLQSRGLAGHFPADLQVDPCQNLRYLPDGIDVISFDLLLKVIVRDEVG